MIYRPITISCAKDNLKREKISMYEHGAVSFMFTCLNGNQQIDLSSCTGASYIGTKPDGHLVGIACDIKDGKVILPISLQMTTAPGILSGVVVLYFESGNVRFNGVNFEVLECPDEADIESTDEFTILEGMIAEVKKLMEQGGATDEQIAKAVDNYLKNNPSAQNGKSAFQIAIDNGFKGTEKEWLEYLKGEDGTDGVGIISTDATSSNVDGGTNTITFNLSNGKSTTLTVKNGSKGSDGQDGKDYTLTDIDKQEIVDKILTTEGIATEKYVDESIANIKIPEGGGSSGGNVSEVLIDFTTEEEVQLLEFPLTLEFVNKINNAQDIIVELIVKKPVADEGTAYGNVQVTFYSPHGTWNKAVLISGNISPSNSVSWGKNGYGITSIKKGKQTWVGNQMVHADNVNSPKTSLIGRMWRDLSAESGDKLRISSDLPMGVGTQIRLTVSGVEQ